MSTDYLPIWFQAIKGDSAVGSGIHVLPSILAVVVFSMASGGLVTWLGYYTWACILSSILAAVVRLDTNSSPHMCMLTSRCTGLRPTDDIRANHQASRMDRISDHPGSWVRAGMHLSYASYD